MNGKLELDIRFKGTIAETIANLLAIAASSSNAIGGDHMATVVNTAMTHDRISTLRQLVRALNYLPIQQAMNYGTYAIRVAFVNSFPDNYGEIERIAENVGLLSHSSDYPTVTSDEMETNSNENV